MSWENIKSSSLIAALDKHSKRHSKCFLFLLLFFGLLVMFLIYRCNTQSNRMNSLNDNRLSLMTTLKQMKADNNDLQIRITNLNKERSFIEHEKIAYLDIIGRLRTENEDSFNKLQTNQARREVLTDKLTQRNENNNQLDYLHNLYQNIESLQSEIDSMVINNNNLKNRLQTQPLKIDSTILTTTDELDLIITWLNKRSVEFRLLYRMSTDGYSPSKFHLKCDNYVTLTLIKTIDRLILGGYTEASWGQRGFQFDLHSFLFNLSLKKKYEIGNPHFAVFGGLGYLGVFGFRDLVLDRQSIYSKFPISYGIDSPPLELTGGKETIEALEIEVFSIQFK